MPELYIAEVKKNDSSKCTGKNTAKDGRVQIYIEWLHQEIAEDDLPWAKQDREWTSNIPEIGDKVWVWFEDEKNWRHPFYKNKLNLKSYPSSKSHNETIGQITSKYPDVKYILLKNGVAIGLSSGDDAEISIFHPKAEIYINKDGELKINATKTIDIKDDAGNEIKTDNTGMNIKDKNKNEIQMTTTGIKITGGNMLEVGGTVAPTGSGAFCGLPNCLFAGSPHSGDKSMGI